MINNKPYNKTSLILYVHAMCIHFSETSNNLIIKWSYSNCTVYHYGYYVWSLVAYVQQMKYNT